MPAQYDITDALNASIKQQFTTLDENITISNAVATSNSLTPGKHRIIATDSCWVLQGDADVGNSLTANADGIYFPAGIPEEVTVSATAVDGYIAVIGDEGTLCLSGM